VPMAQRYVAGAIRNAPRLGRGHGPMDHFWPNHDGRAGAAL
jgi:hydroxymethylpyrimidine/phosphomethylpyrimidine kinase